METKIFAATKAFIHYNGKILILRESNKYSDGSNAAKYDVVGGRVNPGQRFDESLLREIGEDHDDFQWIDPKDYKKYNLTPNLLPAFESYLLLTK
jgi:hypothetical protein